MIDYHKTWEFSVEFFQIFCVTLKFFFSLLSPFPSIQCPSWRSLSLPIPYSWFGFPAQAQANQAIRPSVNFYWTCLGRIRHSLFHQPLTLYHCMGEIRVRIASTISRGSRMCGAYQVGIDSPFFILVVLYYLCILLSVMTWCRSYLKWGNVVEP